MLVIGGTGLARELAEWLQASGVDAVLSLAGVTREPVLPDVAVRMGGFGGARGLADYLIQENFDKIVDATHPFAANISRAAAAVASSMQLPIIRLEVPPWRASEGDQWLSTQGPNEAAAMLPAGAGVLLTTGRRNLEPFLARTDIAGIVRCIEPPDEVVPPPWKLLLSRPPFTFEQEKVLMSHEGMTVLVAKNSGGKVMRAKLDAARSLGIPVIMIERPEKPKVPTVAAVDEVLRWLQDAEAR
ncbi:MAG: cobalt-precorrin-6A reductase [Rhizobiales bacterium]|nr:cobalt-precorrin-6A reductase [Hyphomicrobiales bacterium]